MLLILLAVIVLMIGSAAAVIHFVQAGQKTKNGYDSSANSADSETDRNHIASTVRQSIAPLFRMIGLNGLLSGTQANTAQEFLPFDRIEDSMICLKENGKYYFRMILECTSINYSLKTDEERDIVDSQFRNAVTGWNFPWGIYVQTRELDNRAVIEQTRDDINAVSLIYPKMAEYGRNYLTFMTDDLSRSSSKALIKRKYIIICCNTASLMTDLNDEEKQEWAFNQLFTNAQNVISSLSRIGISAHICRNWEISEIIYQSVNKKTGGAVDGISSGEFLKGSVTGEHDQENPLSKDLSFLIHEFINQLHTEIIDHPEADFDERTKALSAEKKAWEMTQILDDIIDDRQTEEILFSPNLRHTISCEQEKSL